MAISLLNGILIPSAVADAPIQLGEYVTMGAYNGDPIKWRCVAFEKIVGTDENGNPIMDSTQTATEPTAGYLPLMLADTYVCSKMFDMSGFNTTDSSHGRDSNNRPYPSSGGSNYWADSNLRCWLNSDAEAGMVEYTCGNRPPYWSEQGFLTYFTQQERDNIKTVTQKSLLAECDYNALPTDKRSGSELYAAESLTSVSSAVANYNVAYSELVTDQFFLLDVQQLKNVYDNGSALGVKYYCQFGTNANTCLLRGVRFSTQTCGVTPEGKVCSITACHTDKYVRPAFYLNQTVEPDTEPTTEPTMEPTPTPTSAPESTPPSSNDDEGDDYEYYRPPAKNPSRPSKTPKPTETPKPVETPVPEPSPEPTPAVAPPVSVAQFSDVSSESWYYEPVSYVLENSLMVGMTDTEFAPEAEITRAMFVTVLYRMAGEPDLSQEILGYPFRDVEGDSWYAKAVYWARLNGIVEGHSPEEFAPHEGITREQMAVIVYRYAKMRQYGTEAGADLSYTDASGISDYAREAVSWNAANALMRGHEDNSFDPQANTTRAQAAVIFEKLHQNRK